MVQNVAEELDEPLFHCLEEIEQETNRVFKDLSEDRRRFVDDLRDKISWELQQFQHRLEKGPCGPDQIACDENLLQDLHGGVLYQRPDFGIGE